MITDTLLVFLPVILAGATYSGSFVRGAAMPYGQEQCSDIATLGVSWYYNWHYIDPCPGSRSEYMPMVWGAEFPTGAQFGGAGWLMGPNEPNYRGQAVATPEEVAAMWPQVEATGRRLVSPAVSACESESDDNCFDRFWLEKFMTACQDCRIDAISLHWFGCDVYELAAYLDRRAAQFDRPLWLTEWACPSWAGDPAAFMRQALPVVEARTERNAWFATRTAGWQWLDPLVGAMGLTELGREYAQ